MAGHAVSKFHVRYSRDEGGWWVASVRGVRGCHAQGRTVDEARRRVREALGLFVDNADAAMLVDDVKLPADAIKAVRRYSQLRRAAAEQSRRASAAGRRAVEVLTRGALKLSARDAAKLLGLSHQRVHQLLDR